MTISVNHIDDKGRLRSKAGLPSDSGKEWVENSDFYIKLDTNHFKALQAGLQIGVNDMIC